MRKNHHGKKDRLVKRVFALCLALAVICTCLVPVFATEGLSDLQVEKELPGTSEEEAAGFGDDFPAVDDGEPREVYDDSEAAGFGEEEAAPASVVADARPAEGPKLIQTGQLNWPIPVLTASGLMLVAVGAYLMERSKKREKNA